MGLGWSYRAVLATLKISKEKVAWVVLFLFFFFSSVAYISLNEN